MSFSLFSHADICFQYGQGKVGKMEQVSQSPTAFTAASSKVNTAKHVVHIQQTCIRAVKKLVRNNN